jgi:hypothetical protein
LNKLKDNFEIESDKHSILDDSDFKSFLAEDSSLSQQEKDEIMGFFEESIEPVGPDNSEEINFYELKDIEDAKKYRGLSSEQFNNMSKEIRSTIVKDFIKVKHEGAKLYDLDDIRGAMDACGLSLNDDMFNSMSEYSKNDIIKIFIEAEKDKKELREKIDLKIQQQNKDLTKKRIEMISESADITLSVGSFFVAGPSSLIRLGLLGAKG